MFNIFQTTTRPLWPATNGAKNNSSFSTSRLVMLAERLPESLDAPCKQGTHAYTRTYAHSPTSQSVIHSVAAPSSAVVDELKL